MIIMGMGIALGFVLFFFGILIVIAIITKIFGFFGAIGEAIDNKRYQHTKNNETLAERRTRVKAAHARGDYGDDYY